MRILPVFYVLCCCLFLFSCGDTQKKEGQDEREENSQSTTKIAGEREVVLFFGTSLTAGMGLDPNEAYPAVIQQKIDSAGWNYEVVNAGLSGETTASGRNRIDWVLNQDVEVFFLELGANDGLRGIPLEETRKNLQAIIDIVREKNPQATIILAGMQIPPNMGREYTTEFREIFPQLAEKNDVKYLPFLLEGVAGDPALNQQDGIHPTAEGQEIMASTVWKMLEPELQDQ
ncbi:arylesterase [Antarcticibacterium flavum]|uniref:Arylesterase n=1 Tax=Antarcticibacterium flavum TaxID=2058175 RepID=A0A5B7X1L3_9FLAO|nr:MULTISPECIES: arylesterase [Antarcticibacterium]MCM4158646.1 arylesterase [Antarcticibacterium sp. W02-3]QCY68501.1 arylesterase [Antarcticibacterium flavum]